MDNKGSVNAHLNIKIAKIMTSVTLTMALFGARADSLNISEFIGILEWWEKQTKQKRFNKPFFTDRERGRIARLV